MNRNPIFPLLMLLCFISMRCPAQCDERHPYNCFSILVGNKASAEGAVLFAHNEDDWGDRIVNWYKAPALQHTEEAVITLMNGGTLKQATETWSYLWLQMPEMEFSDSYMNQWGVTIASDQCLSREDNPELSDGGIGYWLRRAMAERGRTAREAVKIGGMLVEQFGYTASGRTYCIADPNESWMMSVVNGKHWVAQRVPDNHVAIIPNYYTIGEIDLQDTLRFLGSSDIVDYAVQRGWYDPKTNKPFNFRRAYSRESILASTDNTVRHLRALRRFSGEDSGLDDVFPFSFEPAQLVSLTDLFDILRDHNEGSEYDESENYAKGHPHAFGHTICCNTTQYGFVAELRNNMPVELGAVMWLAPFRPCVHPFVPWYLGMETMPQGFAATNPKEALENHFMEIADIGEYAPDHHFPKFVSNARDTDNDYANAIAGVQSVLYSFEEELITNARIFEEEILPLFLTDKAAALGSITEFSTDKIIQSVNLISR